ncbi:hypothetical protein [Streptomyces apocyni]|uniref:hypothetical protein n=1 Tax=Streptomyces apocyni TaxID=2654677 RepID=UPI0012EA8434|nr:hypothetical protein [Streptomyces apocyni]
MDHTEPDEARLRRAFAMISDEAGEPDHRFVPASRRRNLIRALVVAAAFAGVFIFIMNGLGQGPGEDRDDTGGKTHPATWIACSKVMAEGTVDSVRDAPQNDRVILTLNVSKWLKPATGDELAEFTITDPAKLGYEASKPGQHVLLVIENRPGGWVSYYTDSRQIEGARTSIERALPEAEGRTCEGAR